MAKYFITGRQGSGKSSVIKELARRGYTAYNTDDLPDSTKLQDRVTGESIDWPDGKVDWSKYAWNWQRHEIELLLSSSDDVFLGAIVSNQKEFYALFDEVFVLVVNSETLSKRLETHEHATHHLPGEKDRLLKNHESKQQLLLDEVAKPLSAEATTREIVDQILTDVALSGSKYVR